MRHDKALILVGVVLLLGMSSKWAQGASVGLAQEKQGWDASVEYTALLNQDIEDQTSVKNHEIDQSSAVLAYGVLHLRVSPEMQSRRITSESLLEQSIRSRIISH